MSIVLESKIVNGTPEGRYTHERHRLGCNVADEVCVIVELFERWVSSGTVLESIEPVTVDAYPLTAEMFATIPAPGQADTDRYHRMYDLARKYLAK